MQKQDFRKIQKNLLNSRVKFGFKNDFLIFKECLKIIKKTKTKNVLLYCSLPYEPNLLKFRHILNKKCQIFVPFMQGISFKSVKYRLPLAKKKFGVMEPRNSFLKAKLDLAIVPVIGVDRQFKRIGHGKGFYDRFFESLFQNKNALIKVIFVQIIDAKTSINLSESHDLAGDFYISPYKKYFRKIKNGNHHNCSASSYRAGGWRGVFSCHENKRG